MSVTHRNYADNLDDYKLQMYRAENRNCQRDVLSWKMENVVYNP